MTKLRDPDSLEYAIARCLTELRGAVKDATGKSESYIQMCSDPDNERQISLRDALRLDLAMQGRGAGAPIGEAYRAVLEAAPNGRAGVCPMAAFLDIAATTGNLAKTVQDGLADGALDLHERRAITFAAQAAIEALRELQDAVDLPAPQAGPAPIPSARETPADGAGLDHAQQPAPRHRRAAGEAVRGAASPSPASGAASRKSQRSGARR